ncbi:MAG: prepilin peptidase [Gemmatimonadota bacterium]|nr:prepilin peptidase [Gemmatimonadota bacterium]MDE2873061.1 prepilin peptidase [Gemmatimonadota bacterium]
MTGGAAVGAAAVLGACAGSFLNVCVARWPGGGSALSPPSRCDSCAAPVRWFQNIPVFSYLALRGRCARCDVRLTLQYPLVEVAVALIWAGLAAQWGAHPEAVRGSLFLTVLLGIALTDARTYIIPDQFTLGGTLAGLALAPMAGGPGLAGAALGAAVGFGLLWLIAELGRVVFGKDAMGGGDVKMMAMAGAFLGPAGVILTLFAGALIGSIIFGPVSMRTGRLVPFGIFLAVGAGVAYGWGDVIIAWYLDAVLRLN